MFNFLEPKEKFILLKLGKELSKATAYDDTRTWWCCFDVHRIGRTVGYVQQINRKCSIRIEDLFGLLRLNFNWISDSSSFLVVIELAWTCLNILVFNADPMYVSEKKMNRTDHRWSLAKSSCTTSVQIGLLVHNSLYMQWINLTSIQLTISLLQHKFNQEQILE
jgi:hypothetical protein